MCSRTSSCNPDLLIVAATGWSARSDPTSCRETLSPGTHVEATRHPAPTKTPPQANYTEDPAVSTVAKQYFVLHI